jgi:hypothetical protein
MSSIRGWAGAAIVIGLIGGPITACVGVLEGAAVGLASGGGDCGGGCSKRHADEAAEATWLIFTGLIGGAALVFGGIVARRSHPRAAPEPSPELPSARVVDVSRRAR